MALTASNLVADVDADSDDDFKYEEVELEHNDDDESDNDRSEDLEATMRSLQKASIAGEPELINWSERSSHSPRKPGCGLG